MNPDFSQKTINTIARRAAFLCSNPNCRVSTVGPNVEPSKSTVIGESAHIFGARPGSARHDSHMSEVVRAEITNAIWLCRNCHKKVDEDPRKYPADILFAWREEHEEYVAAILGKLGDDTLSDLKNPSLYLFQDCPPLIKRIAIDKPRGWEWRLTAELMRHFNGPTLRRLEDLRAEFYTRQTEQIDDQEVPAWLSARLNEMQKLISPLTNLTNQLNIAWGDQGEPGDEKEIFHICQLMRDAIEQTVQHEERLWFARVPDAAQPVLDLLKDVLGSQVEKIADIPNILDEVVSLLDADHSGTTENPYIVERRISLELPEGWEEKFDRELRRMEKALYLNDEKGNAWGALVWTIVIIGVVIFLVF